MSWTIRERLGDSVYKFIETVGVRMKTLVFQAKETIFVKAYI